MSEEKNKLLQENFILRCKLEEIVFLYNNLSEKYNILSENKDQNKIDQIRKEDSINRFKAIEAKKLDLINQLNQLKTDTEDRDE